MIFSAYTSLHINHLLHLYHVQKYVKKPLLTELPNVYISNNVHQEMLSPHSIFCVILK